MQKTGLGFDFIRQFEYVLEKIFHNPHYPSFIIDDARSATMKRFPYEIIYRVDVIAQQVRIIAIIHQRRNPEWFRQRIKE
jgi:plasmid stabilization system protein ParE